MKIKVCGLADAANAREVAACNPDYLGFIFYPKSARYIPREAIFKENIASLNGSRKVGVFVNATKDDIIEAVEDYQLDMVQLHGDESPGACKQISTLAPVIKAFRIDPSFDFRKLQEYEGLCRYFLFDTASANYGGSGHTFDWSQLSGYKMDTPFFLSGGISPAHADSIRGMHHPALAGIDLNSKFEIRPGLKDIQQLKKFIDEIRY